MQALLLHSEKRPPLGRGAVLLPIRSWTTGRAYLRVLRATERGHGRAKHFLTLVHLPDDHPVAVIVVHPSDHIAATAFHPLSALPKKDRETLDEGLGDSLELPDLSATSARWMVRLVAGAPIPKQSVKWTKDVRLLDADRANTSTKRR